MRAELPWNVAGIPPEAREAARAAARREGLSVGEWLTRRILRSFSGMEEEASAMPYETRTPPGVPLDSWGLPASAASRRDSEEMLARVGRSENESNEAWRRIEEQLRGLGRRLDSSERSHSESNRVISRTAQEMNISAREQAQAFEQLGQNVLGLNERLERLERSTAHDGIREAVKALHQGLSRLADQISSTANNSATQLVQVTTNLEKLAGRVGQMWEEADGAVQALDQRIDSSGRALDQRIEATGRALDQRLESAERATDARLSVVEKTAQFNTNALDHALEKIEASASQRANDQVEHQRHTAQHEEGLHRLEDAIARLETSAPDTGLEDRLGGIERSVSGLADRLEQHDPAEKFDTAMQALSYRLEKLENYHAQLVAELHSKVLHPEEPPAQETQQPPASSAFEAPPLVEPPPVYEPSAYEPHAYEPVADFSDQHDPHEAIDAFTPPPTPHGFTFDIPQDLRDDSFAPEFAEVFTDTPAEPENFLAQARRSARAASEKAESERHGRLSALRWNAAETEEKARPRYLIPVLVALVVVLAAAAALVLSQRAKMSAPPPIAKPANSAANGPTFSVPAPPDSNDTQFVVAPQAGGQSNGQSGGNPQDYSSQRSEPAASDTPPHTAAPLQQREVRDAPVNVVKESGLPKSAAPVPLDRVIQMANAGNPVALTILGLRAVDGGNGAAVNLPDAVKFLTQAAEKGQAVAQYRLGTLYERGQGVPADAAKAVHWYEMAANQGNRKAMHNLAVAYAGGASGKKNMAEAARWFAKAAALGLSDSQFNLAVLYERGDGVPQSLVDAYKWYSIAAAAGDGESKARIGVLQTQLSDADKAAANKSAATFHAAALNRSANVPPEPADLGS
jgi:localization factor PodJL